MARKTDDPQHSDSSDVVIPRTMTPSYGATLARAAARRTRVSLHARRLAIALGVFRIVAASALGQTPVFIEDSVSTDEAGPSGITAVTCGEEGTTLRGTAC